jgi:hypothetical protein
MCRAKGDSFCCLFHVGRGHQSMLWIASCVWLCTGNIRPGVSNPLQPLACTPKHQVTLATNPTKLSALRNTVCGWARKFVFLYKSARFLQGRTETISVFAPTGFRHSSFGAYSSNYASISLIGRSPKIMNHLRRKRVCYNLTSPDDGLQHSKLLRLWTLSVLRSSR